MPAIAGTAPSSHRTQRSGCTSGGGADGGGMRALVCSRLLGRAAAFSSSLLQPGAGAREATSKVAVAAQARASRSEAVPVGDAATDAKVHRRRAALTVHRRGVLLLGTLPPAGWLQGSTTCSAAGTCPAVCT